MTQPSTTTTWRAIGESEWEYQDGQPTGWYTRKSGDYLERNRLTGESRDSTDPCQPAKHERRYYNANTQDMLRHSGGRTFEELCQLVGRTAVVTFSDYGCSGERISWTERVTITKFWGSRRDPIYGDEGYEVGWVTHPYFDVRCVNNGVGSPSMDDLLDIQPPDRVARLCWFCNQDQDDHARGCPEVIADQATAIEIWWSGHREYTEQRSAYDWYLHGCEPTYSNPTFKLGHQAAQREWYNTHP
jgi:hypothetical protein